MTRSAPSRRPAPEGAALDTRAARRRARRRRAPGIVSVLGVLQCLGFAYVVFLPVSQSRILYPVLALVTATSLGLLLAEPPRWSRLLVAAAVLYLLVVAGWLAYGVLADNPGTVHQSAVWVAAPAIWATWALTLRGAHATRVMGTLRLTLLVCGTLVLWFELHGLGWLPFPEVVTRIQAAGTTLSDGELSIRWLGLSTLGIGAPFAVAAAVLDDARASRGRWLWVLTALVSGVAVLSSGRRALMLSCLAAAGISLVVALARLVAHGRRPPLRGTGQVALVAVCFLGYLATPLGAGLGGFGTSALAVAGIHVPDRGHPSPATAADGATVPAPTPSGSPGAPTPGGSGPGPDGPATPGAPGPTGGDVPRQPPALNADDQARADQTRSLLDAVRERPAVGFGLGAVLESGYRRSETRPWVFELQYVATLMDVGVVGIALLLGVGLLCGVAMRRAARWAPGSGSAAGAITAACLLLANATNPYLQAVGHQWGLFLGLGLANAVLTAGRGAPVEGGNRARSTAGDP